MAVTIEQIITLLNKDLELEYSAAIQYINHAAVMTGEEIQHAVILADQIDYLGGSPSVNVGKIMTSKDNREMLQQDLDGEEDAIKRYKIRVEQAESLKEYALAQQLRTILATEQEHAMDLKQALGK
jgi:bacterioferritin